MSILHSNNKGFQSSTAEVVDSWYLVCQFFSRGGYGLLSSVHAGSNALPKIGDGSPAASAFTSRAGRRMPAGERECELTFCKAETTGMIECLRK
jgi:hypothetical protein